MMQDSRITGGSGTKTHVARERVGLETRRRDLLKRNLILHEKGIFTLFSKPTS